MSSWSVDGRSQADTRPSVTAAKEEVSESASALVSFAALTPRKRVRPSGLQRGTGGRFRSPGPILSTRTR